MPCITCRFVRDVQLLAANKSSAVGGGPHEFELHPVIAVAVVVIEKVICLWIAVIRDNQVEKTVVVIVCPGGRPPRSNVIDEVAG